MTSRDHILAEIRRLAAVGDGKPPGWRLFANETGLREWDWKGKFWSKWGDALVEAGFQPNKLNEPYPEQRLLEAYAQTARRLGHLPTEAELRLAENQDPTMPGYQAFGRFGTKAALVAKLITFCGAHAELSDVLALGQSYLLAKGYSIEEQLPENEVASTKAEGHVYLLHFGGDEYKIGCSNNVERRFREIKTQMPYDGTIIHTITTGDPEGIEAYWHQFFKDKRLNGEWFKLSASDIKYFKKRKLM